MNARIKAKKYKRALDFIESQKNTNGIGLVVYYAISCVKDRFKNEGCKRWVEFDIQHESAGNVHVVLMKPGSEAEELICSQNEKIVYLEKLVETLERNMPAPPQACT